MKILVINSGSSSLKYEIFDMPKKNSLAKGTVERIGLKGSIIKYTKGKNKKVKIKNIYNHEEALLEVLLILKETTIKKINEIKAIGHRVVHGGEKFSLPVLITNNIKNELRKILPLAPLHNPANIMGIESIEKILPGIPNVAVFDTSFHQTIKKNKFLYPIPYKYYKKYKIRKYGFHGTSNKYVFKRIGNILKINKKNNKTIICHLGNGSSITAIKNGEVFDTSMGFTPLEGIMMGTRSGDIDASIISFLIKNEKIDIDKIDNILNKESGLLGVSEKSSDMRDILELNKNGDKNSKLALYMYIDRILKYISYYICTMNGVNNIVFTGGIGENSPIVRKRIIDGLSYFNIKLNTKNNTTVGKENIISNKNSKINVLVIPTNEELEIAIETFDIIKNNAT